MQVVSTELKLLVVHITLLIWGMLVVQVVVLEVARNINGKLVRITAVGATLVVLAGVLMIHLQLLHQQSIIEGLLEEMAVVHIFIQHLLQKQ